MLNSVLQDIRYAWRGLRSTPGPFILSLIALSLGTGGATAVFSVVDRILFRPLPYAAQERLVWFGMKAPISQNEFLLEGDYHFFRQHQTVFEHVSSFSRIGDCELNELEPMQLTCAQVASDFLPMLGIHPVLGSHFQGSQDYPNSPRSALLTYGFWQRRFGGDRGVVGRRLMISGLSVQVAGVLPPEFELPNLAPVDLIWTQPLSRVPNASFSFLTVIGRLKPGVTVDQARVALEPLFRERLKFVPAGFAKEVSFHLSSLRDRQVRDARTTSWVLMGCVLALLLIACANVANVLLARAAARHREFAVRAALGASRARLIRQAMTESLLVGIAGGVTGALLAAVLLKVMVSLAPGGLMRLGEAGIDLRVLGFATLLSIGTGLLFGLAPALATPRSGVLNSRTATGASRYAGQAVVAAQIALSFVLLTGAGLLLRSLWSMQQTPLGMSVENVVVARVQLGQQGYSTPQLQSLLLEAALGRLRQLPGTRHVAMSDSVPLYGPATAMIYSNIEVQGGPPADPKRQTGGMTAARVITPGYLEALRIPVVQGRGFTEADRTSGGEFALIDERLAKRLFPGRDPVGQAMRSGFNGPWRTIVGITRAARNAGFRDADDPEYYFLWRQTPESGRRRAHFIVRSEANVEQLSALIRNEFAQLDGSLPLTVTTMEQQIGRHLERPRFQTMLLAAFALIGLILAAVGQFGLISCLVTQRRAEIAIRMALGARGSDVVSGVMRRTMAWTLAGSVAGLAGAWTLSQYLQPLLFGVAPRDATVAISVLAMLILVSAVAAWQPAARAAATDPAQVLRHD